MTGAGGEATTGGEATDGGEATTIGWQLTEQQLPERIAHWPAGQVVVGQNRRHVCSGEPSQKGAATGDGGEVDGEIDGEIEGEVEGDADGEAEGEAEGGEASEGGDAEAMAWHVYEQQVPERIAHCPAGHEAAAQPTRHI